MEKQAETAMAKLRDIAAWPTDMARQIEVDAASIASAMASLHGGEWRIQIDHLAGLVLIVPRN